MATSVPGLEVRINEPEWHCQYCNYGEYINGDPVRADDRKKSHEAQCNMKPEDKTCEHGIEDCVYCGPFDDLMMDAWHLTTRDRHNQYGSAEDAFRAYGHIWTGLLAHKLRPDAVIDASDVCLMMTGLKIAREVRNSKRDNVVDAHGYLSLLSRIRGWVSRR